MPVELEHSWFRNFDTRDVFIAILIVSVSIGPEIPIATLSSGTEFTLRFEDLLLVVVGFVWILQPDWSKQVRLPGFYKYFGILVVIIGIVSVLNIFLSGLPPLRATFYLLKQVEVMLIGTLVLVVVKKDHHLKTVNIALIIAGSLNALWAFYQIAIGDFGPFFFTADLNVGRYGTSLVGQPAVLASGGYYIPVICLTAANVLTRETWREKLLFGGLFLGFFGAMAGAVSRSSILGSIGGVAVLVVLFGNLNIRKYAKVGIPSLASASFLLYLLPVPVFERFANASQGIAVRLQQWIPLLREVFPRAIIGWGAGSIQSMLGYAEAHNYFIRILIIGGVASLAVFLLLLLMICRQSYFLVARTEIHHRKTIAMTAIGTTVAYSIVAVFQDAFLNVMISEMFWITTGAMAAALILKEDFQTSNSR